MKIKKKKKIIGLLVSGGLDSAALVGHYLERGYTVWPIYLKGGLRWEKAEKYWLKKFLKKIANNKLNPLLEAPLYLGKVYDRNWSQSGRIPSATSPDKAVYLPARNLLLIINALLQLIPIGVGRLALAPLKGNPFKDSTPSYFKNLERILSASFSKPVKIHAPFRHLSKTEIVRRYRKWPLHLSFSCINPKGHQPCGKCNKCAELSKAFRAAGLLGSNFKTVR